MENLLETHYQNNALKAKQKKRKIIGKIFHCIDEGGVSTMLTTDNSSVNSLGYNEIVVLVEYKKSYRKYHTYYSEDETGKPPVQCWDILRFIGEECISSIFYDEKGNMRNFRISELDKRENDITNFIFETISLNIHKLSNAQHQRLHRRQDMQTS